MLYYLSLGANLGNREQTIEQALALLETHCGQIIRRSAPYYSAPVGFDSQNEFCNICVAITSRLTPIEFLDATQAIERLLGRTNKSTTDDYGHPIHFDRNIDIDIILCIDEISNIEIIIDSPVLTLPHPRYKQREFVMIPLKEIL